MRGIGKRFVYVLRSESEPTRHYVGVTSNLDERLHWHNKGPTGQTCLNRPWAVVVSIEFVDERTAIAFERYLKSSVEPLLGKAGGRGLPASQPIRR